MSQVYPLDQVIRRVQSSDFSQFSSSGQLLIIDARSGSFFEKPPLFQFGRDIRYFAVNVDQIAECEGPSCVTRDLSQDRTLKLRIRYQASCRDGRQKVLVSALHQGNSPQQTLNGLLEKWFVDFVRGQAPTFIDGYYEKKNELADHLARRAREEVGLTIETVFDLEGEDRLGPYPIQTEFPVLLDDCDEELLVRLKTQLNVAEKHRIKAVLAASQLHQLEPQLKKTARKFFLDNVNLHQFHYELANGVRDGLRQAFDEVLQESGRRVSHISLKSNAARPRQETRNIKHNAVCQIKEASTTVTVENTLFLTLQDLGKWKTASDADLDKWCRKTLDRFNQEELFDKSYVDLLLDFDSSAIKAAVAREAAEIGYSVKHHLVIPNLAPLELKNGFEFPVKHSFATRDPGIEAELEIVVSGKIPDLRKIEKLLAPDVDIVERIKMTVLAAVQRLMHGTHPERFYMNFSVPGADGAPSFEEELKATVQNCLQERFHAADVAVITKVLETDLTKRLKNLCKGVREFRIETKSLQAPADNDDVAFTVTFEVQGVDPDGWHAFRTKDFQTTEEELAAIEKILEEAFRAQLETLPSQYLHYRDFRQLNELRPLFANSIRKVQEAFGLSVRIITLRRERTEAEQRQREQSASHLRIAGETDQKAIEMKSEFALQEYRKLRERRSLLLENDYEPDSDEVQALNRLIAEKEKEISYKPPDYGRKLIAGGEVESREEPPWQAFAAERNLISTRQLPSAPGDEESE